ncbi:hypothetical protein [Leptospira sanjuanensis]|uniref:hypothetical protein n=1 Tax=Leptospira sanjuanensis TaxID=2879643 RepID=UPI001EE7E105|nr:hypothetical protein [Leptospira sanjuanensis]MCG6170222.1 hypothetical protein [Leptospira sanjuanensis]
MNSIFNFLLKGIGGRVRLGKGGPILSATPSGIEARRPDDAGLTNLKVAFPIENADAVNLEWVRNEILANWNTPVQNLLELKNIPANERRDKQVREVEDELSFYQFDTESLALVPDQSDPVRIILPNDLTPQNPGRWLKTTARSQLHAQLLGLSSNDHPQYQLRSEKNSSGGFPGLSTDLDAPGIEILSAGNIKSLLKSSATSNRDFLLPDKSGVVALDTEFVGSSLSSNGQKGLVPTPLITDREKFLAGDGSWKTNFGSLKNSSVVSSSYTANKYERVLCDVSGGPISISLPFHPDDNFVVGVLDVSNNASTNPITILRNGSLIEDFAEDWQLDLEGGSWELAYSKERGSWYFLGIKAYNNVAPSNSFLTNTPTFNETSLAPSANAVKEYVGIQYISLLQLLYSVGSIQSGGGYAPPGTLIKNSYFEGMTNASGLCVIHTGLANSILSVFVSVSDNAGKWYFHFPIGTTVAAYFDDEGIVSVQLSGSPAFNNRSVRVWVEYK